MSNTNSRIDDFLLGIAEATNAMISEKLDKGINLAIELLGKHLGVNASCVYVNEEDEQGRTLSSIKYFWSSHRDESRTLRNQNVPLQMLGDLYTYLSRGESYDILYSNSSAALQEHMKADGTKSIILFPIMVEGRFWGSVALVEFVTERLWTDSEKSLLQSLANSIGSAVRRNLLEENLEKLVAQRTEALERSKRRFQLAVDGSQDGIWEWNPRTKENYWSPRMYEQLGYEPGDMPQIGEEFFEMIHKDERAVAKSKFFEHLEKRTPYEAEFRLKTKSGKYRWFKSTGQAQWNEKGEAVLMVGSHEDIHEKKVSEKLLLKSEERFRAVIQHDPNATFLVNSHGIIELHSDRTVAVFGYSHKELAKMTIHQLLPGALDEKHRAHFDNYMKAPDARIMGQGMDLKGRRKNGELFWVEVGLSPLKIRGEQFVMAVATDISKRREAESALKESHRRINNLINNLPGISYRCLNDANWSMEYISAACLEITGYECSDFYGSPSRISFGELIHKDDQQDMWDQVQQALEDQRSYRVIYRIIDRRGREKWLWEQGNGVLDEAGEVEALEGCIFDITPVVRNQERVNGAIYHAEDNERRRIAGEIHDGLQQTLSVSALNLQYLDSEIDKLSVECQERYTKSRDYLEKGIRESRQIAHRLMPKAIHDVGLKKALEDLVNEMRSISDINCSYYCNLKKRLDQKVEVGLFRTTQEALNNILKYARAQKVSVQLIGFQEEIQLLIEDNGIGFDKNKLDLYKTGFGLTGMKNRINSLSGNLLIDSKPGHGTSIIARLPIHN